MKSGKQTYFFLASYDFRSKVLVIVKKIRDTRSEIRKKFTPDPDPGFRGKKAPDLVSATLLATKADLAR
jgi:hypothetical protein